MTSGGDFDRISGMMTARFLLHLRKWEAKHSAFVTASTSDANDIDALEFNSNPAQRDIRSYVSDFGEDPVHRAEQHRGRHDRSLNTLSGVPPVRHHYGPS